MKTFPKSDTNPLKWGVTGGIGSGKSHVCRQLARRGIPVFYCDDEAKCLIRTDPTLRHELTAIVGPRLYRPDGQLDKAVMTAYLCGGREQANSVDAVVHPRVAEVFNRWAREQSAPVVAMECALLFESGFDRLVDRTVHILADHATRLARVVARDRVTPEQAEAWMALQMDEDEKSRRADFVIHNNDGDPLDPQIDRLLAL